MTFGWRQNPGWWLMGQNQVCTEPSLCLVPRVQLRRKHPPLIRRPHLSSAKTQLAQKTRLLRVLGRGRRCTRGVLAFSQTFVSLHNTKITTRGLDSSRFISHWSFDDIHSYIIYVYVHGTLSYAHRSGFCSKWNRSVKYGHNKCTRFSTSWIISFVSTDHSGTYGYNRSLIWS